MADERQIPSLIDQAESVSSDYLKDKSPAARKELVRLCKLLAKEVFNLCGVREEAVLHNKTLIVDPMLDQIEIAETDSTGDFDEAKREWITTDDDCAPSDWAIRYFLVMVPKLPPIRRLLE